jgi:predicted DNA-binding transcriptional regulator YafY
LLALLLSIQHRGRATAAELAEELEVSERTIYRDIATLQAAGIPLWTETGPGGGVRLTEGWRSPLDGLTAPEAAALLVGPSGATGLGLGPGLVAARAKLRSGLPDAARAAAERITERFHLDAPGWFQHDEPDPHLPTIVEALWSDRRLDVRYRSG